MDGIKTISRQRVITEGSCLVVWISRRRSRVMTGGADTSPV
jgi:hypothetical protein